MLNGRLAPLEDPRIGYVHMYIRIYVDTYIGNVVHRYVHKVPTYLAVALRNTTQRNERNTL